ncbi:MAG: transcriptional repressor [Sulfurospirillaceae bacterium]|nr:transcriptional repressor [Sulfurospirillaceae bacterium]MDD3462147.1 transcriptional repressor [Sulfurospirillaceae bacterium]
MDTFLDILKAKKLKATPQRISILKELNRDYHPTMEELYLAIKKDSPSISLATVYKNIATLKSEDVVIELMMPNGKTRYDLIHKPHIHLVCKRCNSIEDISNTEDAICCKTNLEKDVNVKIIRFDISVTIDGCKRCM